MRNAMRGAMHGSIRKTYVKHMTYRKLNICKTSVFPDVAKSWCSKLYGLCAQTDLPSTAPSRWTLTRVPKAFGRRRNGAATVVSTSPATSGRANGETAATSENTEKRVSPMGRNQQHRTGRTRGRRIFIRVSDQEFEEIRTSADMNGVSVSRYLVEAHETCTDLETAKKKYETGPIVEKLESIRTEIWHIGHNVNQIARNTNRDMNASMDDEYSAAKAVRDCARLFGQASDTIKRLSNQIGR